MPLAKGTPTVFLGANVLLVLLLLRVGLLWRDSAAGLVVLSVGVLGVVWIVLLILFFRDPDREVGRGVVSPADGRIREASTTGHGATVSIFLGVFNVHVVRAPIAGRVTTLAYKPGGRRFAFSKNSHLNERLLLGLAGEGESCSLTLIAGAFADRIVPYVEPGATVKKGDRIGIIKFGSRVDLDYTGSLPVTLNTKVGNTVIAGVTPIILPTEEGPAR